MLFLAVPRVLAAKRVVPPVLEFFRSFFAEEERESTGRRWRLGTTEGGGEEGGKGGGYDRQRDDIKNHNARHINLTYYRRTRKSHGRLKSRPRGPPKCTHAFGALRARV